MATVTITLADPLYPRQLDMGRTVLEDASKRLLVDAVPAAVFDAVKATIDGVIEDVQDVLTDLGGDSGGDSVAQAITDLGAVITALGGEVEE